MKKILSIICLLILCMAVVIPALSEARRPGPAVQSTNITVDDRWQISVKLYNGQECETAKVIISVRDKMHNKDWDGSSVSCNTHVVVEWQTPRGFNKREVIEIPGRIDHGQSEDVLICMDSGEEEGMGTIRVEAGNEELFCTEFECENGYIRFGSIR